MIANGRKTIGVFISQVFGEYQSNLSKGISKRAKELDYNVAFFTYFNGYGQYRYDIGERGIADLPVYEDLDGIIIATDTMGVQGLEEGIRDNIKKHSRCPVVSVQRKAEEYYNVIIDNHSVLEEIICHFIEVHGYTRINFLAGPKGLLDSDMRLDSYKRILPQYNIQIEEDRIYYGDFWKKTGYQAVEHWLGSPLEKPQAIICANDFMAITVCNALEKYGFSVPEDIAVSGCDNIADTIKHQPAITTVMIPAFEMGWEAVNKIHIHNEGQKQENNSFLKTESIFRESCGCNSSEKLENGKRKSSWITTIDALEKSITQNAYMSTDLTGLTKLDEINEKLRTYAYHNIGFDSFYMCLQKDWDNFFGNGEKDLVSKWDDMTMEVGIKEGVDLDKVKFSKRELIPKQYLDDKPQIFYFAMLHHQENCFGYAAISFKKIQTYVRTYQAWLINICNALENVRIHGELNRVVSELEDMSIRDAMTGLYNRRGIELLGTKYLKQCVDEHRTIMFFIADMDNVKFINDKYGHVHGDIAIKAVAEALQKAADDDEICMRCGGDEFLVIGIEYNDEKMNNFITNLQEGLDAFNQNSGYEYKVCVSYGWNIVMPNKKTSIEEYINVSDSRMYQMKAKRRPWR